MSDYECPKCKHEHEACGSHEDDEGEQTCDQCGFKFVVMIEYDPSYSTTCVTHEWGPFKHLGNGSGAEFCIHCNSINTDSLRFTSKDIT